MNQSYEEFYKWFWDESIWLPNKTSWKLIKANRLPSIENVGGLYFCIPVTIGMMLLRYVFESLIARPFVIWLGVKEKAPVKVVPNALCEKAFRASKRPESEKVQDMSNQLGWPTRKVELWFRQRRIMEQSTLLKKATECSWRFLFYFFMTTYGTVTLSKLGCFWDRKHCFIEYKDHVMGVDLYIYYMAEIGMYISLSISQFRDVKRKDFWQNLVHHFTTLLLLMYAFIGGYYHIGAVIVYVHDVSDVFLEAAKILHYAKRQKSCDICFAIFAIVFAISRLFVLPLMVFWSCVTDHEYYIGGFIVYKTMLFFLFILQLLHIYWAYFISKIVYKAIIGKGVTDSRSDGEESSEPELKSNDVPSENKKAI